MSDDNAVRVVSRLREGEAYCRTIFIPSEKFGPDLPERIKFAKLKLKRDLSPVVARAKKSVSGSFKLNTLHALTTEYEVVIVGVITRESDL